MLELMTAFGTITQAILVQYPTFTDIDKATQQCQNWHVWKSCDLLIFLELSGVVAIQLPKENRI